ncbi:MAG: colanic acid biosynthesis acetyltransferase WcaF [Planctomycetota bacterium]
MTGRATNDSPTSSPQREQGAPSPSNSSRPCSPSPLQPLLWALLKPAFRLSPQPLHNIRRKILTLCGAKVAGNAKIRPSAKIDRPWNLSLGELAIIGDDAEINAAEPISIGARCVVSQLAVLTTDIVEPDQTGTPDPFQRRRGPIAIEDDSWVATETMVLPGATVRTGTVVGARGLIEGELPEWSVCVGQPARRIKDRGFVNATA